MFGTVFRQYHVLCFEMDARKVFDELIHQLIDEELGAELSDILVMMEGPLNLGHEVLGVFDSGLESTVDNVQPMERVLAGSRISSEELSRDAFARVRQESLRFLDILFDFPDGTVLPILVH